MIKSGKEILFQDGNGDFHEITSHIKERFEESIDVLEEYGYVVKPKNEEHTIENKRSSALYHFSNTISFYLIVICIWTIVCGICIYNDEKTLANFLLLSILLMIVALYSSFRGYKNTQ